METKKIWATTCDGLFEIISLTNEYLEEALEVFHTEFNYELISSILNVPQDQQSKEELEYYNVITARRGLSIIAVEKSTNKVCGVVFNGVQRKSGPEYIEYLELFNHFTGPISLFVLHWADYINTKCDLYEHCNVTCRMELEFLSVLNDYKKSEIPLIMLEVSETLALLLINGRDVKTPLDGKELPVGPSPQILAAVFPIDVAVNLRLSLTWSLKIINSDGMYYNGKYYDLPAIALSYKFLT